MLPLKRLALAATLVPGPAFAHVADTASDAPGWTLEPWLLVSLGLPLLAYVVGAARLAGRSGAGRRTLRNQALLFAAGWLTLALAAASPLHQGGSRSFTLHMIEHELLMLVAAPLLVLARPLGAMLWAFPAPARTALASAARRPTPRMVWGALTAPVPATLLQAAALWLWHAPALFDLALGHEAWHVAQHLSFVISALFFWQAMLAQRRRSAGLAAMCLFATSLAGGALGALMAFSQSPWYARYALLGMAPFGLTPTEDQQMAGLLMWIPGGLVHAGAALALVTAVLRETPAEAATDAR